MRLFIKILPALVIGGAVAWILIEIFSTINTALTTAMKVAGG